MHSFSGSRSSGCRRKVIAAVGVAVIEKVVAVVVVVVIV